MNNQTPRPKYVFLGQVFTERQRDVWLGFALNATTDEIAAQLHLSPKTVEFHRDRLYEKLGLRGYAALTLAAVRAGLVKP